jgi:hypothetical protein
MLLMILDSTGSLRDLQYHPELRIPIVPVANVLVIPAIRLVPIDLRAVKHVAQDAGSCQWDLLRS